MSVIYADNNGITTKKIKHCLEIKPGLFYNTNNLCDRVGKRKTNDVKMKCHN